MPNSYEILAYGDCGTLRMGMTSLRNHLLSRLESTK